MSLQALFPELSGSLALTEGGTLSASDDFEILALALDAAGLTGAVQGLTDFTLFAPSDQAFADLAVELGFTGDTNDAAAVFGAVAGALAGLDPDGDPIPLLTDILLYHVAPESEALDELNGSGPVTTLLDGVTFDVTGGTVIDQDPDATNAGIVSPDNAVNNGTIQVVDQVLLPLDTPLANADPTLLNLLEESGGAPDDDATDFDLLLIALQATGLDVVVDDETAELTVFLPNDGAFVELAQAFGFEGDDEAGALQALLDLSEDTDPDNPLQLVTDVLTYHVSPGIQDATAVLGSETLATVEGTEIGVDGTTLVDVDTLTDDPTIVETDIEASNGIAHQIDGVLLPFDTAPEPQTILELLEGSGEPDDDPTDFDLLLIALQGVGLDVVVDDETADLTVFAPNDGAFLALAQSLGFEGNDEVDALQAIVDASAAADPDNPLQLVTDILTYHVSPGTQDSTAVLGSETLATVQGEEIGVDGTTLVDIEPDNTDPTLIETDVEATNGIVHVIDEVLLPVDLEQIEEPEEEEEEDDGDGGFGEILAAIGLVGVVLFAFAGFG